MREIKKSLDDNYKNFFNFSYDNYLTKDFSESNSDEILNSQENVEHLDSVPNKEANKAKINFTNEISFEDQENKIKNMMFKKSAAKHI